ncbi:protein EARLY FLOWERING 3 [Mercurialis annua]|uniref:protein EARLY FLOWERING 3 n=1 Tax=Mercurialis annua TaxID=3986 RepID=UPI002160BB49|nr:protein EARLY FLOWERING 3 [Mercurialis annua]
MKRGKDDEKMTGPMFPRLHVNDTEKGGPRAPPRNKMALYEQLSIPSQRFNGHGSLPLNPSKPTNLAPAASSSQGSGYERNLRFPLHVPSSTPSHVPENLHDGGNFNSTSPQIEQRKKAGNEDDFSVPVFVHSGMDQTHGRSQSVKDRENTSTFSQNNLGRSAMQIVGDKDKKNSSSRGSNVRQEARDQREACISSKDHSASFQTKDNIARPDSASPNPQNPYQPVASFSSLREKDVCLRQEASAMLQENGSCGEGVPVLTRETERGNASQSISDSHSREDLSGPDEPEIDSEHHGEKTYRSLRFENGNKCDDVSETSMVDSVSALDISPDDVVGLIGQKHFWKARRAIVNQQRLFAVQVFELHRLLKVQRLIATSPQCLLEESTYLGKPSVKDCPAKKLPAEYVVAPPMNVSKFKDDSEKPNHKLECSAENAVGKTSFSKSGSQPLNFIGNSTPVPMAADPKMAPLCFHHSLGHQWLVPVMSPSEGLVYKPFTAPEFTGGGSGPYGMTPLTGNFINPNYGIPASHLPHQGTVPIPGVPSPGHGYLPPYGMQFMNPVMSGSAVEQMNYAGSDPHGQLSGRGANFNMQHQNSCNVPLQKRGSTPQVTMFQASKESELHRSTASSPSERAPRNPERRDVLRAPRVPERRDALTLFPMDPAGSAQPQKSDQPRRVIKVVPHNRRSATESAARIFQSIQEERKQYDSM